MSSQRRAIVWIAVGCFVLILLCFQQSSELSALDRKIGARQERLERVHILFQKFPALMRQQRGASPTQQEESSLATWFSKLCGTPQLEPHVDSITPSFDEKKNRELVNIKFRSLTFSKAMQLLDQIKKDRPTIMESDIHLSLRGTDLWDLSGTWSWTPR